MCFPSWALRSVFCACDFVSGCRGGGLAMSTVAAWRDFPLIVFCIVFCVPPPLSLLLYALSA